MMPFMGSASSSCEWFADYVRLHGTFSCGLWLWWICWQWTLERLPSLMRWGKRLFRFNILEYVWCPNSNAKRIPGSKLPDAYKFFISPDERKWHQLPISKFSLADCYTLKKLSFKLIWLLLNIKRIVTNQLNCIYCKKIRNVVNISIQ
jgi:hypothetical protein